MPRTHAFPPDFTVEDDKTMRGTQKETVVELITKKVGEVVVLGLAEPGNLDSSNVEDFRKKMI